MPMSTIFWLVLCPADLNLKNHTKSVILSNKCDRNDKWATLTRKKRPVTSTSSSAMPFDVFVLSHSVSWKRAGKANSISLCNAEFGNLFVDSKIKNRKIKIQTSTFTTNFVFEIFVQSIADNQCTNPLPAMKNSFVPAALGTGPTKDKPL